MLDFNPLSLRYKFIFLTKDVYQGNGIHNILKKHLPASSLQCPSGSELSFYLIDEYIKFIPFSLRFSSIYQKNKTKLESDVVLSAKYLDVKRKKFTDILFFVDMYNPELNSFMYINPKDPLDFISKKIAFFLEHCAAVANNQKAKIVSSFILTLRDQQILFYSLAGLVIKEIARELGVSDKVIYKERDLLTRKIEKHQEPALFGICDTETCNV